MVLCLAKTKELVVNLYFTHWIKIFGAFCQSFRYLGSVMNILVLV